MPFPQAVERPVPWQMVGWLKLSYRTWGDISVSIRGEISGTKGDILPHAAERVRPRDARSLCGFSKEVVLKYFISKETKN